MKLLEKPQDRQPES